MQNMFDGKFLEEMMKSLSAGGSPQPSLPFDKDELKAQLEKIEMAKKLNASRPSPRTGRLDRFTALFHNKLAMMQLEKIKEERTDDHVEMKQTYITGESPCCKKPLEALKPILFRQMQVPMVHSGRFLICRVLTDPNVVVGVSVLVEDTAGDVELLQLFNFTTDLNDVGWLKQGMILIVKEPYMKFASSGANPNGNNPIIRVDSPSDVIFVHKTNQAMLSMTNALRWFGLERMSFAELKEIGNESFKKRDYRTAVEFYERALKVSDQAVIHLNLATAFLQLKQFKKASDEASKALHVKEGREKALFRLGKASYGMRRWQDAINHFTTLLSEFPTNGDAEKELDRSKARLRESLTGDYDLPALFAATHLQRGHFLPDLADYVGPIRVVDIPRKGKGVVATKSIAAGTLLLATKAYAIRFIDKDDTKKMMPMLMLTSVNLITKALETGWHHMCMVDVVQRLAREPETANDVYALYAGKGFDRGANAFPPEGVLDVGRIERICSLNCFGSANPEEDLMSMICGTGTHSPEANNFSSVGDANVGCGLWLLPSFFNHSCLANCNRVFHGDMMFVYALEDIIEGQELTMHYLSTFDSYTVRQKKLEKWGFECQCRLCDFDRHESPVLQRQRDELAERSNEIRKETIVKNPRTWLTKAENFVQKIRATYKEHPMELRVQLFRPLSMLYFINCMLHRFDQCVIALKESIKVVPLHNELRLRDLLLLAEVYAFNTKPPNLLLALEMIEEAMASAKISMGVPNIKCFCDLYPGTERFFSDSLSYPR